MTLIATCVQAVQGLSPLGTKKRLHQVLLEYDSTRSNKDADAAPCHRTYWETFFVVLPMFCGYASLFGLQHDVKVRVGIEDGASEASNEFGFAVSFLYIFNLLSRLLHGVVLGYLSSRQRVLVAMPSMTISMILLALPDMPSGSYGMHRVMLAYAFGGIGIGCFEPNFLSCIAPLGHQTKRIAILGIPVGISSLLIFGFFIMGPPLHVPVIAIYVAVACAIICGMPIVVFQLPRNNGVSPPESGVEKLASDIREWRSWLPQMWSYGMIFMIDMFTLAGFSPGVALYMYDGPTVTLIPGVQVPTDSFFAGFNVFNMLGSLAGRWLSYRIVPRHPSMYIAFNALGVLLLMLRVPLLVPVSTFLIMLGDGLIYGSTTMNIDASVPREFNLVATSCWCLLGDIGAIVGANLITPLQGYTA